MWVYRRSLLTRSGISTPSLCNQPPVRGKSAFICIDNYLLKLYNMLILPQPRGSKEKRFILTIIYLDYYSYTLIDNPLSIPIYLRSLDEYQTAKDTSRKYYIAIILYSKSRRVLKAKKFGLIISAKDYYNIIRKIIPNKDKPKIIDGLFIIL